MLLEKNVNLELIFRLLLYHMYTRTLGRPMYVYRRNLFSIVSKLDTYKLRNYKRYKNNAHFYRNQHLQLFTIGYENTHRVYNCQYYVFNICNGGDENLYKVNFLCGFSVNVFEG